MTPLDRQLLCLAATPDLVEECRALIMVAGAVQAGKLTLNDAIYALEQPGFPSLNLPSAEGAIRGKEIAANVGEVPGACPTCAFRAGTIPNQSLTTLEDAIDCVASGDPFLCHHDGKPCRGWMKAREVLLPTP